ncbi:MAG TPA: hypothetical protein PKO09_13835 [Anaerolineae bacterium]|nr:hypothetical protein [Anaerolineae bacterium]
MRQAPSPLRIIGTDYLASLSALFPLVAWAMALGARFFDPGAAAFFLRFAPAVTAAGLVVIAWRVWLIRSVVGGGTEVPGAITGAGFFRGRGRVEYVYTYQGKKLQGSNAVQANRASRSMVPGRDVTVMIDPLKPKRAFVRELYL